MRSKRERAEPPASRRLCCVCSVTVHLPGKVLGLSFTPRLARATRPRPLRASPRAWGALPVVIHPPRHDGRAGQRARARSGGESRGLRAAPSPFDCTAVCGRLASLAPRAARRAASPTHPGRCRATAPRGAPAPCSCCRPGPSPARRSRSRRRSCARWPARAGSGGQAGAVSTETRHPHGPSTRTGHAMRTRRAQRRAGRRSGRAARAAGTDSPRPLGSPSSYLVVHLGRGGDLAEDHHLRDAAPRASQQWSERAGPPDGARTPRQARAWRRNHSQPHNARQTPPFTRRGPIARPRPRAPHGAPRPAPPHYIGEILVRGPRSATARREGGRRRPNPRH